MQKRKLGKSNLDVSADPAMPGRRRLLAAGPGMTAASLLAPSLLGAEPSQSSDIGSRSARLPQDKPGSPVFFTKDISANGLLEIYSKINENITGKVAIKLHTGEPNGPNILPRDMVKALQQHIPIATWWKQIPCIRARDILRLIIAKPSRSTAGISAQWTSWTRTARL